jgi:hypothetical protein
MHATGLVGYSDELVRVFPDMIDAVIHRNPVQPRFQAGFPPEASKVFESFDENILGEVHGVFTVLDEPVTNAVNLALIPDHELIEGGCISRKVSLNQCRIGV